MSFGAGNKVPTGYKTGRLQQFTPEQMQLFQSLFGYLEPGGDLARLAGGDQSMFEQMEAPALRQFSGLQGQLASRFSGMGSGARRSSGFQNTATQASSEFAQDLQSRRMELQRQALSDLMGMSGELLNQRPYQQFLVPKEKSGWQKLLGGITGMMGEFGGGAASTGGNLAMMKLFKMMGLL